MAEINQLSAIDTISAGDLLVIWDASNSDARKAAISVLQAYMQNNLAFPTFTGMGAFTTQYSAPSSTGFNVTITDGADNDSNIHLILTPTAGFATGTLILPTAPSIIDKQEVLVNCTQSVTSLAIAGGLATVTGEPTTLTANNFFRLKYDLPSTTWYRVG